MRLIETNSMKKSINNWIGKSCSFASASEKLTSEMKKWFEERTKKHIALVGKAIDKIVKELPEFDKLTSRKTEHDKSKFESPEYDPYIWISWKYKCKQDSKEFECPKDIEKQMNEATLHHIKNNRHHPEFHLDDKSEANIDPKDRDKSKKVVDVSNMPDLDIAEMVADWQAMSEELKKNTAREWYNQQKDVRWSFSDKQDKLIDKLLKIFE